MFYNRNLAGKLVLIIISLVIIIGTFGSADFTGVRGSDQAKIPENFFKDGNQANTKIVVGSNAAFEDIKSANELGLAIGKEFYRGNHLHLGHEEELFGRKKVPIFSNYLNRPGNSNRDTEIIVDEEHSDLSDNQGWYDPALNEDYLSEDWSDGGDLLGSFSEDSPDQVRQSYILDIKDKVSVHDESSSDVLDFDIDLRVKLPDLQDKLLENNVPARIVDLEVDLDRAVIQFSRDEETHYSDVFGEESTVSEFNGVETGDKLEIFGNSFNIADIDSNRFYFGTRYDSEWGGLGEVISFEGYDVEIEDIQTSGSTNEVLVKVSGVNKESSTTIMEEGEMRDFFDNEISLKVESIFSGVGGTNRVQISAIVGKESVAEGDNWPSPYWGVNNLEMSGDLIESIELESLRSNLEGETVEIMDQWRLGYEYRVVSRDVDVDSVDEYAFESWLKFSRVFDSEYSDDFLVRDDEVALNADDNLILIGGPVANSLTEDLVSVGRSEVDWSEADDGRVEFIEGAYGLNDVDVLIVAGSTRDGTESAVRKLVSDLRD